MSRFRQIVVWAYLLICLLSIGLQLWNFTVMPLVATLIGIAMQSVICVGLWHYARQTPCWTAYSWRMLVLLQFIALGILGFILLPLSIKYGLLLLVVQLPITAMLWRYSAEEQPYWFSQEHHQQGALLHALLQRYGELRFNQQRDTLQASVHLTQTAQGYQADIQRQQATQLEQFQQRYHTAAAMAAYLEAYALVHVTDFLSAYPLDTDALDSDPLDTDQQDTAPTPTR